MSTNQILTIVLATGALLPLIIWIFILLRIYLFPPKKFTIESKKTGKIVSFNLRGKNDAKSLIEFGNVFLGRE